MSWTSVSKLCFAHYFSPYPRRINNLLPKALGGAGDYYDTGYLDPNGEGGIHKAYGGLLRDRPVPVPVTTSGDFEAVDMAWEVATAKANHIDGFTVDLLSIDTTAGTNLTGISDHSRRVKKLLAAASADGSFQIVLMPDMSGWAGQSVANVATTCANLAAAYSAVHREGGKVVIAPFLAENWSTANWTAFLAAMSAAGQPAVLVPCFLNYGAYVAPFVTALGANMIGASHWGDRTPANNGVTANKARITDAHNRGLFWMQPVAFQDVRPNQAKYAEACNTLNLRLMWQAAIEGGADWIQGTTWNDFSEGTQLCPSVDHGNVVTELFGWYAAWWKAGSMPAITSDQLVLTHRKQLYAATPTFPETSLMVPWQNQPPQDTLEVHCRLVTAATITLQSGTNSVAFNAPAGLSVYSMPLQVGTQKASLSR